MEEQEDSADVTEDRNVGCCRDEEMNEDDMTWDDGSFWQHMPDDLIIHIFSFLDCNSLLEASKTCKTWRRVTADESLWKDLVSYKVGKPRNSLPDCDSYYQEYRRLCMNVPNVESESLKEHNDEIYHVLFSPSGRFFSTTGRDGLVVVWELSMPTTVYTAEKVVEVPSYTRYSEFNQSETKLLVAGIDMGYFFDGFIKIYKFGRKLETLCVVRIEFPNFRGTWFNDDYFITMSRTSDERNGHYLQVRTHYADRKLLQNSFSELTKIKNNQHRNDFMRVVDKSKWPAKQNIDSRQLCCKEIDIECCSMCDPGMDCTSDDTTNLDEQREQSSSSVNEHRCDKSLLIHQTSTVNYHASLFQYHINNKDFKKEEDSINFDEEDEYTENKEDKGFTLPQIVCNSECTVLGTNLSGDHRYFVYSVRPKTITNGRKEYSVSIETRVYDLQNDKDTGEIYLGATAVGTDHVSYIFPTISQDYIAGGSENLKAYIWDRKFGNLLSVLVHDCGVHSQNGVNATAFCPSDQEVLVTVSDDLIVRVWRSRQKIHDSRIASVIDEGFCKDGVDGLVCSSGSNVPISCGEEFDLVGEEKEDKVTCCYGFRPRHKVKKKNFNAKD